MASDVLSYLLFEPLDPKQLPLLKDLTTAEICRVWDATSKYIRKELTEKRAVDIGIGSFAVVPAHAAAGEDGVLDVDRPIFQLNKHIQKFYKIKKPKIKIPFEIFEHPLNFQEIAESIYFRVPIVEQCIRETLLFFAEALRGKKEVDFFFKTLGILSLRGQEVIMNFFDDCVLQVDATGNMLPALLGDSEMMNMIAFRGKNKFTRLSEDGCVILPRIQVQGSTTCQDTVFIKPRRQSQPWKEGARRVSVYDPVMLARHRASRVTILEKRRKEQEKKQQKVKFRLLPQLEQKYAEVLKKDARQAKPAASAATAQQTSRVAARLQQAQTEARRLQVLMASKRKEVETEIHSEYQQCVRRLSTERSQNPFHRLLEGDPRPAYVVRRDYDRQLGERLKGKDRCQSPAGQTAPEGWQNKPQLPRTSREQKGEKTRLLDRRGKAQGRSHHGLHQNAASGASNTQAPSGRTSHRCTLPSL